MNLSDWLVYFVSHDGFREGNEFIVANSRKEAIEHYRNFFNVPETLDCKAIRSYGRIKEENRNRQPRKV